MIGFFKPTSPTKNPTLRRAIIQSDQNNFPKRLLSVESDGSITQNVVQKKKGRLSETTFLFTQCFISSNL
jgi:hypothetical protein